MESGEVTISAVRHKKPRAKSEPCLSAALAAEEAHYEKTIGVRHNPNPHIRDHGQRNLTPAPDVPDDVRNGASAGSVGARQTLRNDSVDFSNFSFLKMAEDKLEKLKNADQAISRGEHPETHFGVYRGRKDDVKKIAERTKRQGEKSPAVPDFWEVGEESHNRHGSDTSWSSGRGSLGSEHRRDESNIQVRGAVFIEFCGVARTVWDGWFLLAFGPPTATASSWTGTSPFPHRYCQPPDCYSWAVGVLPRPQTGCAQLLR